MVRWGVEVEVPAPSGWNAQLGAEGKGGACACLWKAGKLLLHWSAPGVGVLTCENQTQHWPGHWLSEAVILPSLACAG